MIIYDGYRVVVGSAIAMILSFTIIPSFAQEQKIVFDTAPVLDHWSTGPEVGDTIPAIVGLDQHGNTVTFDDIKGPNGLYIVFHRSADW